MKNNTSDAPLSGAKRDEKLPFAFEKENYILMVVGVVLILGGFLLMALESAPHGFGFIGLTLSPIIVFSGFMFEIYAIFHKPKAK
jgi:membrane-bound ClpP family serine protease